MYIPSEIKRSFNHPRFLLRLLSRPYVSKAMVDMPLILDTVILASSKSFPSTKRNCNVRRIDKLKGHYCVTYVVFVFAAFATLLLRLCVASRL